MSKILLAVTGSIAAYKACDLTSKLVQKGHEVRVILSEGAKYFVGDATFEGLTGSAPLTTGFEAGSRMAHIHWARWADLILVYPASANTVQKLAHGLADDLLGMTFLAHDFKKPFLISPAMNPTMLNHPATKESLTKLSAWGVTILESDSGRTACGEEGSGRLMEPLAALAAVEKALSSKVSFSATPKKVLISAGGTSETIDAVRVLTNTSTGETGVQIARELKNAGCDVHLLISASATVNPDLYSDLKCERFTDFDSLQKLMKHELSTGHYDSVIHAAAVSDYALDHIENLNGETISNHQKIHSGEGIKLSLKPNPKIVNQLREYSKNKKIQVVSFKLTTAGEKPNLESYMSDYIVHNDLSGLSRGTDRHEGEVLTRSGKVIFRFHSKSELSQSLKSLILGTENSL